MAEITLKTRLLNKYNQSIAASEVLGKGEIHFEPVSIPVGSTGATETAVLMKVGDGSTTYENLKYVAARAADVYDWAKAADKPIYKAEEIDGLSDYISGEIKDTNTTYTFAIVDGQLVVKSKEVDSETLTEVAKLDFLTPDELTNVLSDYVTNSVFDAYKEANSQALADAKSEGKTYTDTELGKASLNAKNYTDSEVATALADAKSYAKDYADGLDQEIRDDVEGHVSEKITEAKTEVNKYTDDKVKALADQVGAVPEGSTVMGIINEIQENAYDDTELRGIANQNKDDISDLKALVGETSVDDRIGDALEAANDYTDTELKGLAISIEKKEGVDYIVLKDNDNVEITSVNATAFVKDGMLTDASYNAENNKLTLTWNTDSGLTTTDIDLNDLVDTYTGGNGINVSTAGEISLDEEVVNDAIDAKIEALKLSETYEAKGAAATALSEAKSYADQAEADAVATAAADAKSKADAALDAAKAYANSLEHKDTTYTAGTGLVLNGTVFSIDPNLVLILDAND